MRKATCVSVNTERGGYDLWVGSQLSNAYPSDDRSYPIEDRKIEAIEVYIEEYPDGVETVINIMSGGKIARQLINCPVDILYQA